MLNVCLTHDVDRIHKTYQYITKPLRGLLKGNLKLFAKCFVHIFDKNAYWGFNHIYEIETKYCVKSTFFFLNESLPFNPFKPNTWKLSLGRYNIFNKKLVDIIRFFDKNGWEIALHGSYRSYKSIKLLKKEKADIEKIVCHSIHGVRQHYLNLTHETWEMQSQAGFCYDSTWGLTDNIGFKNNQVTPFFPISKNDFCVIPLTIMDYPFVTLKDKWARFEEILKKIELENGYLVINFHNNNFYELDFPDVKTNYIRIIEILKQRNAKFMTMMDAYKEITKGIKNF